MLLLRPAAIASGRPAEPTAIPEKSTIRPFVAHADWSKSPGKRWAASAHWTGSEYLVQAPAVVAGTLSWLQGLRRQAGPSPLFVGFDFPIGVPASYGPRLGLESFPVLLRELGRGASGGFGSFFAPARRADEISLHRPFYPAAPGGTSQRHLTEGLGVGTMSDLLRVCERATPSRPAANALFWTLGPKQVGYAAITGWRDVLAPAARHMGPDLAIWPFDGGVGQLLASPRAVTILETYPAEACLHIGIGSPGKGWSKRRQEDRIAKGRLAATWASGQPITLSGELQAVLADGFGPGEQGEDPFDAVVGLLSMLAVVLGVRGDGAPEDAAVTRWEGWILGQQPQGASVGGG